LGKHSNPQMKWAFGLREFFKPPKPTKVDNKEKSKTKS